MYGYIYKITNLVNGKVYIGQTTKLIQERFEQHIKNMTAKDRDHLPLYVDMKKFGIDKFIIEQIDTANNQLELNQKEIYWINYYKSNSNIYNIAQGGNALNPMHDINIKALHDKKMQTNEVRNKISKTLHELRTTIGFSEEHKQKIKAAREKRKQERATLGLNFYEHPEHFATRSVPVYCILNTGEKYDFKSINDACIWRYNTFKPFGEKYVAVTLQRKIEASIVGKEIAYRETYLENGIKKYRRIKVANIKWYINSKEESKNEDKNKN